MNESLSALMVGGPVDGEWWVTDGRGRIFVPVREDVLPAFFEPEDVTTKPVMKTHEYIARDLRSQNGKWVVYQDAAMDMDIIEALITGYRREVKGD